MDFGIAAVPDAVFDLGSKIQLEACKLNVVLVGYGVFVPYLLLGFHTFLKKREAASPGTTDVLRKE